MDIADITLLSLVSSFFVCFVSFCSKKSAPD